MRSPRRLPREVREIASRKSAQEKVPRENANKDCQEKVPIESAKQEYQVRLPRKVATRRYRRSVIRYGVQSEVFRPSRRGHTSELARIARLHSRLWRTTGKIGCGSHHAAGTRRHRTPLDRRCRGQPQAAAAPRERTAPLCASRNAPIAAVT